MRQLVISKCDSFIYYKVRQLVITKCDSYFITKCDKCYYKVRQVLQSVTVLLQSATAITKWDRTGFDPGMQVNGTFLKHIYVLIAISMSWKKFKLYFECHWSYIFFKTKKGVIISKRTEILRRQTAIIKVTKKKKSFYEKCKST